MTEPGTSSILEHAWYWKLSHVGTMDLVSHGQRSHDPNAIMHGSGRGHISFHKLLNIAALARIFTDSHDGMLSEREMSGFV